MANHTLLSSRASRSVRALVALLVVATALGPIPIAAASTIPAAAGDTPAVESTSPPPAPVVTVNRTVPKVSPVPTVLAFSSRPSEAELRRARVFAEPLLPTGATNAGENRALAAALLAFVQSDPRDRTTSALDRFLAEHPRSVWRLSLLANLGTVHAADGAMSRALAAWDGAWQRAKDDPSVAGRAIADYAVGEWLDLKSKLGHVDETEARLNDLGERVVTGSARTRVRWARQRVGMMRAEPDQGIAPGAFAVAAVDEAMAPAGKAREAYTRAKSMGTKPRTLAALMALGNSWRLPLKAIKRAAGTPLKVPSVVQWKAGHVGAVVAQDGDKLLVRDARSWSGSWIRRSVIEEESTDAYLVPAKLATSADVEMAATALPVQNQSLCPPGAPDPDDPCPCDKNGEGNGMAVYWIHPVTTGIRVQDIPVGYTAPRGPDMHFMVRYNEDDQRLPQTPFYGNFGRQWSFTWLSFVMEENTGDSVHVYLRGSGIENHWAMNANGEYPAHQRSRAVLVRTSADPIRYERRLPDGSVETFEQADGPERVGRRIFFTEFRDPQGQTVTLTYDAQLRLIALTDSVGQVTALTYAHEADPMKVTQVTDPFGRSASFAYDAAGRLSAITDVIGMTSRFAYNSGDLMSALITPYGTTSFRREGPGEYPFTRWMEATDPLGGTERVEYNFSATPGLAATAPASEVPAGVSVSNQDLNRYNSYYWNKRTMELYPRDYSKAVVTHWVLGNTGRPTDHASAQSIEHSIKKPLESRVWYRYTGQSESASGSAFMGRGTDPTVTARVLDDGTTQAWSATYNQLGHMTSQTDPVGRRTTFNYAANGIDLLEVLQTTGALNDRLVAYENYTTLHQPERMIDASGQSTYYAYGADGRILTSTNPKGETTTYTYGGHQSAFLQSVLMAQSGATWQYSYDSYGRTHATTSSDGATVVFEYDPLDRTTREIFDDGTTVEMTYDRLGLAQRKDRQDRREYRVHDAMRRVASVTDGAGRSDTYERDASGRLLAIIDAKKRRTAWQHDIQGRVVGEVRADGSLYSFSYDNTGRLSTIVDPKQQQTSYTYARDDRMTAIAYANSAIPTPGVIYGYDSNYPRIVSAADGIGTTQWTYHAPGSNGAGQPATIDGPFDSDTLTFEYDLVGRIARRTIAGTAHEAVYAYDSLGRLTAETNELGVFGILYVGATNRLSELTYPNGQRASYLYLPASAGFKLQQIHHTDHLQQTIWKFNYQYDSVGRLKTWRQDTGSAATTWEYAYDRSGRVTTALEQTDAGAVLKRRSYGYDAVGNRLFEQRDDTLTTWTYDAMNRATVKRVGGALVFTGKVDEPAHVAIDGGAVAVASDGRFSKVVPLQEGPNTVQITAVDSSGNPALAMYNVSSASVQSSLSYDGNGNLVTADGGQFAWDAADRLVQVQVGAEVQQYSYDAQYRRARIERTVAGGTVHLREYVWCGLAPCEERGPAVGDATRLYDRAEVSPQGAVLTTTDHLGSTRSVTNDAGAVVGRYSYDPFGELDVSLGAPPRYGFTGHLIAGESGLLLARYRAYSPRSGRWISEDPIGFAGSDNFYAYVENDPLLRIDPLGLQSVVCKNCGESAAAAATSAVQKVCSNFQNPQSQCRNIIRAYKLDENCFAQRCKTSIVVRCMDKNCASDTCGGPCVAGGDYRNIVFLQPNAFKPGGCFGPLASTAAHEMAHMCGLPPDRTEGPNDSLYASMGDFVGELCGSQ